MASLIEQLLSGATATSTCNPDISHNATTPIFSVLSSSRDAGIIGLIVSLAMLALRSDWAKLAVLGAAFEAFRRGTSFLYAKFWDSIFLNAYFQEDDPSFDWMMVWLSRQPGWANARDIEINTDEYGDDGATVVLDSKDDLGDSSRPTRKLAYLPSLSRTYSMWYKRRLVQVTRTSSQTGSIMSRSNKILLQILQEARQTYSDAQENSVCVYVSDTNNNWRNVASRPKRSLQSVVLDEGVKDALVDDAKDFLASKSWYAERGIPFRRGYLLYGAPGSGKTSLIHSLAGELGLDVYIVSLSRSGLDDAALAELLNELPERCVALMEDIDAAFTHSVGNRDQSRTRQNEDDEDPNSPPKRKPEDTQQTQSRLSLSGLLNALDGVGAQEGRILFATTNHFDALDPALRRPGRMDWYIEFKLASQYQAGELFKRFYFPIDSDNKTTSEKKEEVQGEKVGEEAATGDQHSQTIVNAMRSSHRIPKMTREELERLATDFAASIPDRRLSMAALQGYLMSYKTRPVQAVKEAAGWVEGELSKKYTPTN